MTTPTNFIPFETNIDADWLNPVSNLAYDVFSYYPSDDPKNNVKDLVNGSPAATPVEARFAIYACDQSPDDTEFYVRYARTWYLLSDAISGFFPEAPEDGLSYARQNTGTPDSYGYPNQWTRTQRVYVQETDPRSP
jgi:hypothetical protein